MRGLFFDAIGSLFNAAESLLRETLRRRYKNGFRDVMGSPVDAAYTQGFLHGADWRTATLVNMAETLRHQAHTSKEADKAFVAIRDMLMQMGFDIRRASEKGRIPHIIQAHVMRDMIRNEVETHIITRPKTEAQA